MTIYQLDVVIRAGAVTTMLLLAWLIFRDRRQFGRLAVLFLPLAICLSAFVIGNTPVASLRLGGISGALANSLIRSLICRQVILVWLPRPFRH